MKKRSLLLFALCAQMSYAMDAQSGQSPLANEQHDYQELHDKGARPQEQHLDQVEPRMNQQESVPACALPKQQPEDNKAFESSQSGEFDNNAQTEPAECRPQVQEQEPLVFAWTKRVATYSLLQLSALTAGVAIVGYGCYQGCQLLYDWYNPYIQKEQPMTLSLKDRDILLNFAEAMGQDVKQARVAGKRKASVVQKFDVSGLSMPLLIECNYIQNDFVKLYHQCDDEGNGIEELNLFYCEFNHALKELIQQAIIV